MWVEYKAFFHWFSVIFKFLYGKLSGDCDPQFNQKKSLTETSVWSNRLEASRRLPECAVA